ncbi:cytochrome c oxidase assembly protein [Pseudonocardia sp. MH-G8]|uniref:cytochrome c oxidase assembly protein n=1 Tax=Pseudonocardia sp. MH-G8 TaxID=1854588 RepID=UPI000BA16ABC|nr:cytochrome c oxidase assembly protein [Pseudonocardia sp. MH-G8]OZM76398.1 cytochrome C oxidase assembly protein [Pseudonocardia sp. MH-G8]
MRLPELAPGWLPPTDPPPLTPWRLLSSWTFDPAMLVPLAAVAIAYLWGVRVLRRRGDPWKTQRVLYFFAGLGVVFVGVSSSLGVYDRVLFTVPAVQHMLLQMIAPVGLVLGAPLSLALRTLPVPWRKRLLVVVHSRPVRFIAHPAVAFALFAITQFVYYYTPVYEASLRNVWVHDLTHVHFVLIGFLFYWSLLGIDPLPHRLPFVFRFLLVVGMAPVHIVLGIPIMMMDNLFAPDFYLELGRTWGPDPVDDQQMGGAILWGFGDVSAAALIGAFAKQWNRSDERLARRTDRQLDRAYGNATTIRPWWLPDTQPAEKGPDVRGPQRESS